MDENQKSKLNIRIVNRPPTFVYFTDAHNQPTLPLDRFHWLAAFVNDIKPDYFIDGGDFDDLNSLCRHERNDSWSGKFKPAFMEDLAQSDAARKILHDKITCDPIKHVTLGNHEQRLWDFEDANPEIYGMMQHAYMDILGRYGWGHTKYKRYKTIEGIDFTHMPINGMGKAIGGKTPCNIISRDSIRDVCFGHTHGIGLQENHKLGEDNEEGRSVVAFNGGCFMPQGYRAAYSKGAQKNYWYGAHVLQSDNGRLKVVQSITMKELERIYG